MIDVKELRIGNLCQTVQGLILSVSSVDGDVFTADFEDFGYPSEDFQIMPIPITEEWLLKLGFPIEADCHGAGLRLGHLFFVCNIDDTYSTVGLDVLGIPFTIASVQYVHKLQNLYFALTGKELEIKENQ